MFSLSLSLSSIWQNNCCSAFFLKKKRSEAGENAYVGNFFGQFGPIFFHRFWECVWCFIYIYIYNLMLMFFLFLTKTLTSWRVAAGLVASPSLNLYLFAGKLPGLIFFFCKKKKWPFFPCWDFFFSSCRKHCAMKSCCCCFWSFG